jgi:hypothetical protein
MGTVRMVWYPAGTEEVGQDGYLLSEWVGTGTQLLQRR